MSRYSLTLLLVLVFVSTLLVSAPAQQNSTVPPPDLDDYVARAMKTFEVPGIGLAIVKDSQVLLAKGYGVRELGDPAPVDAKTLFGIASNTKVFTATALGLLVEEGRIQWDGRVIDYLPWFQMWDPYVTRELTVRDLLVHRSGLGLGAGDLLWWPTSTYNREEIAHRLRYIQPATSFRSAYAYDNVLYLVAGEVIEAISSRKWEDFVSARILAKVGMNGSKVRHSDAAGGGNIATPHAEIAGKVKPIAPFESDNTNPAGGINSNAEDMAKWLLVQLNEGQLSDGSRLFSSATARQLTALVTPMPIDNAAPELAALRPNFQGYALGLVVRDYRGRKVVTHTGGLPGCLSLVYMVPEEKLGVAVLTNQESSEAFNAIGYHVVDHYLSVPSTDWIAAYDKVRRRSAENTAGALKKSAAARDAGSKPSLPLEKYAGAYRDGWYGDISIAFENGRLAIRFTKTPALSGELEHWQYDTFVARWKDRELRADAYVSFALAPDGSIDAVRMRPVSPDTDFSFDFQDLLLRPIRKQP